ncbi:hypothetical protein MICRO11B_310005 [Micrococcus luteus]|nr:hypothetical protein MICRO116_760016 [Micrococcus sp. 116]VXB55694.1 hypothetical protein MICRO11B_310005 [Micrococcus luteus]
MTGVSKPDRRATPAGVAALIRPLRLRIRHAQDPLDSLVGHVCGPTENSLDTGRAPS